MLPWKETKAQADAAEARRSLGAYIGGYRLRELRKRAGFTQTELANAMGVSQARISQLERGDVQLFEVDTIRRYAAAIGGRLRIVVDFDNQEVTLI
ncbi:helix-turn-helix domain-containing protein [Actinocrispum wychmicini]|uniref:Helix-turn-helix protein n=1 Tax=Actinocrispum wychmicini TaxID=1213861 RepID=A0A4V2S557_9PSEU|nr:XRE family transcriptional regulator [Actinocrispum wychmicini]TCO50810.1 helix-turn-helix protein [Actinocrispum wychmicini]